MPAAITLRGRGLFTGEEAVVTLSRHEGPLVISVGGREKSWGDALAPRAEGRTTVLEGEGGFRVSCVEHLFAAVGALSIGRGLHIASSAPELPLLDGAAAAWLRALRELEIAPSPPRLRILRRGTLVVDQSVYELVPGPTRTCAIELEMQDPRLDLRARWDGTAEAFARDIASARTFVSDVDLAALAASGSKATADPESIVVLGRDEIFVKGRPFARSEPAQHKLLDLIGDLTVHGGPPLGTVRAVRPGHAATHEAMARARAAKLVE